MLEGVGKGQDLWHFPSSWKQRQIPVSCSNNPVPPTRVAGAEGNPAGLWPHPATRRLLQTISLPASLYKEDPLSPRDLPPYTNTKSSPLGMVPLAAQTLSSSSKDPLSTTQEPGRPIFPLLGNSAHPHSSKLRPCFCLEWAKASTPWQLLWQTNAQPDLQGIFTS